MQHGTTCEPFVALLKKNLKSCRDGSEVSGGGAVSILPHLRNSVFVNRYKACDVENNRIASQKAS